MLAETKSLVLKGLTAATRSAQASLQQKHERLEVEVTMAAQKVLRASMLLTVEHRIRTCPSLYIQYC